MSKYVSAAVPFETIGNRQCLSYQALAEDDNLADFVKRFPKCFAHDPVRAFVVFYPEGDAPRNMNS